MREIENKREGEREEKNGERKKERERGGRERGVCKFNYLPLLPSLVWLEAICVHIS